MLLFWFGIQEFRIFPPIQREERREYASSTIRDNIYLLYSPDTWGNGWTLEQLLDGTHIDHRDSYTQTVLTIRIPDVVNSNS